VTEERSQQPSRAEEIRKRSAEQQKDVIAAFARVAAAPPEKQLSAAMQAVGTAFVWALSYVPEIAAQLAEANERDREAEIRAKNAEMFVAGMQAEIQKLQRAGVIPIGAVEVPGKKK
jgi:hypothetical protein